MRSVDEKLLHIDAQNYWLWIAYEPGINTCLMKMHLSKEKTIFVCYQFFKQLQRRYSRKLIFTEGALWYNDACRWLRLRHWIYGTELNNIMERFIQYIKGRTECFDDNFPWENQTVMDKMYGTGSNYSSYTCRWAERGHDL
jgi:putative transposase